MRELTGDAAAFGPVSVNSARTIAAGKPIATLLTPLMYKRFVPLAERFRDG
jgi:hypothetical protein